MLRDLNVVFVTVAGFYRPGVLCPMPLRLRCTCVECVLHASDTNNFPASYGLNQTVKRVSSNGRSMEGAFNHAQVEAASFDSDHSSAAERRVLIVEHDVESVTALQVQLSQAGFKVSISSRGEDARLAVDRDHPHVVMVDWDLPAIIAMDLLRHLKRDATAKASRPPNAPRLIALSSFASEQHVVSGFELGVDDYVIKPFSVLEVVARVRAVLRPMSATRNETCHLGFRELQMDAGDGRVVTVQDRAVSLRHKEFQLLQYLIRRPERAHTREALLLHVWGRDSRAGTRAVDVTVQRIRRALTQHGCGGYLQTIRGVGYRLSAGAP